MRPNNRRTYWGPQTLRYSNVSGPTDPTDPTDPDDLTPPVGYIILTEDSFVLTEDSFILMEPV